MKYSIIEIQEELKTLLSSKRFLHSLGVQYTSANLAMRYGCDLKKAEFAGILHDCAKYMSDKEMLNNCYKYSIPVTEVEKNNAFLLHAKLGSYYAKNRYYIEDEEILSAITYHTTGKADMSLLEKIVFIADYIEPSRNRLDGLDEIRKISYDNLDMAAYLILRNTLQYLKKDTKREIDPMTVKAYEYYKQLCDAK